MPFGPDNLNDPNPARNAWFRWALDVPECGKDFCELCGDCLHCFPGGGCYRADDNSHAWYEGGYEPTPADYALLTEWSIDVKVSQFY